MSKNDKVPKQKPQNMCATIKRFSVYVKKSSFMIILAFAATIAGTVMQVYSPKKLGTAITLVFDKIHHGSGIKFDHVGIILLTVAVMYVGIFITTFLQQCIMVLVAQKSTYTLRNELKEKMNKVPISYFDKNSNGNLMSVAANDIDNIVTNL